MNAINFRERMTSFATSTTRSVSARPKRQNYRGKSTIGHGLESLEDRRLLAATPELVLDINPTPNGTIIQEFESTDDAIYVRSSISDFKDQLWKSDGTNAGTVLLKNDGRAAELTNVNGTLFFRGTDNSGPVQYRNEELWKSDGTADGTVMVKDITPGSDGSFPNSLTSVDGTLYFITRNGFRGSLWKSDGTAEGTVQVSSVQVPIIEANLTNVNGTLYFRANDGVHGYELWKSDGTAEGTVMVKDINPGSNNGYYPSPGISRMTNVEGELFFSANDGMNGVELWKTDGTEEGTVMVKDVYPGTVGIYPGILTNVGGTLFFAATDASHGRELWKSDGTAEGTVLVKDISPSSYEPYPYGSQLANFTNVGGTLFFVASEGVHGQELWKSDGTAEGTVLVKDINEANNSYPGNLIDVGGKLFFHADDGVNGRELWTSDGTAEGTAMVVDIRSGSGSGIGRSLDPDANPSTQLINLNGIVLFAATDETHNTELWKSDGTASGTALLKELRPGSESSFTHSLTNINDKLFFATDLTSPARPGGLWTSDGTAAGTKVVRSFDFTSSITEANNAAYFVGSNLSDSRSKLYRTDGTTEGTVELKSSDFIIVVDSKFLVVADARTGIELWKTDGTKAGTVLVKDIHPGTENGISTDFSVPFLNINGTLYFTADDGVHGEELWKSDGTEAGTVLVKDIRTGDVGASARHFANVGGKLFFTAEDGEHGRELWQSDGTEEGTNLVYDIRSGKGAGIVNDFQLTPFTSVNGTVYFAANDGTHGQELWKSDGTSAGTLMVKDIQPGRRSGLPDGYMTNVEGTLFLAADDGVHGVELWQSDGTDAGTVMVNDLNPGIGSSIPYNGVNVDGILYFTANDGVHGEEMWQSDGTEAGTSLIDDLNPGELGSRPGPVTKVGDKLFFTADDGFYGRELWVLNLETTEPPIPGDSNHDGIFNSSDFVKVFQAGEYEDGVPGNSTFEEGDWNGDSDFDSSDFVHVFQIGNYVREANPTGMDIDSVLAAMSSRDLTERPGKPVVVTSKPQASIPALIAQPVDLFAKSIDRVFANLVQDQGQRDSVDKLADRVVNVDATFLDEIMI